MHPGDDGRLWAINPESGFFGVAPGTSAKTNPNALAMLNKDCIFTNVGVTANNEPWWEGKDNQTPVRNWRGEDYQPGNGPAAHPNSRFTAALKNCPAYSEQAEAPQGVPISAIIFGGRRESLVPLVFESRDWQHGVLTGASMASETTAAATGAVGLVRRDPMAMKPFCGYNFGDYWGHWLSFDQQLDNLPKIFHVNWFRKDDQGHFMWPGFGDNLRVLEWIIGRCKGELDAQDSPIGLLPKIEDLNLAGLDLDPATLKALLEVDESGWAGEYRAIGEFLDTFGDRLPDQLRDLNSSLLDNLDKG